MSAPIKRTDPWITQPPALHHLGRSSALQSVPRADHTAAARRPPHFEREVLQAAKSGRRNPVQMSANHPIEPIRAGISNGRCRPPAADCRPDTDGPQSTHSGRSPPSTAIPAHAPFGSLRSDSGNGLVDDPGRLSLFGSIHQQPDLTTGDLRRLANSNGDHYIHGDAARHFGPGDCLTCRPSSAAARPIEDLLHRPFARGVAGRRFPVSRFSTGLESN